MQKIDTRDWVGVDAERFRQIANFINFFNNEKRGIDFVSKKE